MRISRRTIIAFVLGALPLAPAFGFDGAPVNPDATIPVVSPLPATVPALKKPIPPVAVPAAAQYDLARLYLRSAGASRDDFRYGTRWLGLAAQKGQHQAQALLGQMLFNGDQMPPQRARGLMWLTLARDSAAPEEAWIKESYNKAITKASDNDRAMALQMLEHWVQGRKD